MSGNNQFSVNNGMPLTAQQVDGFEIHGNTYQMASPIGLNTNIVRGPIRGDGGFYSRDFRACTKLFLSRTAQVWRRAAQLFERNQQQSLRVTGVRLPYIGRFPIISGSKVDIITSLKTFVANCPHRNELLCLLVPNVPLTIHEIHPNNLPLAVRGALRREMQMYDNESWLYHRNLQVQMGEQEQIDEVQMVEQEQMSGQEQIDVDVDVDVEEEDEEEENRENIERTIRMEERLHVMNSIVELGVAMGVSPQQITGVVVRNFIMEILYPSGITDENGLLMEGRTMDDVNRFLWDVLMRELENDSSMIEKIKEEEVNPLDELCPEPELIEGLPMELIKQFECPITYEIMRDPVIDPEGNSYERLAIEHHLKKNGTSPITRRTLRGEELVENRALKSAIDAVKK